MKRCFAAVVVLLALCMLLAGCKGKKTTTTSSASSVAAQPTPEPTPTLPPYEANALTGEPKGADYPEGQRITGVMVNNIVAARPQRGLSNAQMLVEIKVEGGITRFMALYNDYEDIGEIGPVRSGRDQFFQLILPWQALYIHEGQSVVMQQYASDYQYGTMNNNNGANGYRDYSRVNWAGKSYNSGLALEHTMYTNSDNIAKVIANDNIDMKRTYNSTFFNFVDYRQDNPVRDLTQSVDSAYSDKYGPIVTDGEYVEITHSQSYKTRFIYDAASKTYKMQQNYSDGKWRDTVDEANGSTVLSFPNVIVLYTDIHVYPGHEAKDLQEVEYGDGGVGYYCYGGKREKIFWQKGTPLEALRLYYATEDGRCSDTPVEINIGKSYLAIVDLDFVENFKASSLDGVDISAATTVTYESSHADADNTSSTAVQPTAAPQPAQEQPAETTEEQTPVEEQPAETTEEPTQEETTTEPSGGEEAQGSTEGEGTTEGTQEAEAASVE